MKFTDQHVGAGLTQVFMSLLGELETKGALVRQETLNVFDRAATALRKHPDDPINQGAAAFVDMLSAQARSKN